MKKGITLIMSTAILSGAVLLAPYFFEKSLPLVKTTYPEVITYSKSVIATGEISKLDAKEIKAEYPVVISEVFIKEGDSVKSGDKIAAVDIEQTKQKLMDYSGIFTLNDTDINEYSDMEIPAFIYSNCDGTAENVLIEKGSFIQIDEVIIRFGGKDDFIVSVPVSEKRISEVKIGYPAVITGSGFEGIEYKGVVEKISDTATKQIIGTAQETVVNVVIKILNADEFIRVGYSAKAEIKTSQEKEVVVIPYEAIMQEDDGSEYLYVLSHGVAVKKEINPIEELSDGVRVKKSELNDEPLIIANGNIKEGKYVKVAE